MIVGDGYRQLLVMLILCNSLFKFALAWDLILAARSYKNFSFVIALQIPFSSLFILYKGRVSPAKFENIGFLNDNSKI